MEKLTSRERLLRIFKNQEVDRPSLKLWGLPLDGQMLHPSYEPVIKKGLAVSDIFAGASSSFDICYGKNGAENISRQIKATNSHLWNDHYITMNTPLGTLTSIERISTIGEPSYTMEYFIKEPDDIKKLLSIKYEPYEVDISGYLEAEKSIGQKGITVFGLDHAGYALARQAGSMNLGYLIYDEKNLLHELVSVYAKRIEEFIKDVFSTGVKPIFGWVGPELLTPPLLGDKEFDEFVLKYDKPICDLIHNGGGYTWVHCHGKVAKLLDKFIDMGVDVLNPLEPPKNGDVNMEEIAKKYGNKIGLEGNIEIQDIIMAKPSELKELIYNCVKAGRQSDRFILCPSAGFMEYVNPSTEYIENLMLYLDYGLECVRG